MKLSILLTISLFCLCCSSAIAGATFSGGTSYKFGEQNTTVTVSCGGIANTSRENATGTLMLRLWALNSPYVSGTISGTILASYKLEGLNGGASYKAITKTLKTALPSARKAYVICLTLLEYKNGAYQIADHRNFSGSAVLGPLPLFTMTGPWSWHYSTEGATLDMSVAKIAHARTGSTGSLKLAVWATTGPYKGGAIRGFELGTVKKDALKPGFAYTDVKNTAKYTRPPPGTYYLSLVLEEFNDGQYKIMTFLPSSTTTKFN